MSAPQAYGSSLTYGRRMALSLMFNLNVAGGQQRAAEPRQERQPPDRQPSLPIDSRDDPPWDEPRRLETDATRNDDHVTVFRRAAEKARWPATDKQIAWLADLMKRRGESPGSALDSDGSLSSKTAGQAIDARRA